MTITYRDAGVDIDAADELVRRIAPLAAATRTAHVVSDVGGFAGLCKLPGGMSDPVLVSGTDGVGTKLKIAFATGVHDSIGIDLVAMCVNDIITTGAQPLFFLDYFGTGKLEVAVGEAVVRGIATGCSQAGCALLGGETAELPGMYAAGEYDLAGFAVGVVERGKILGSARVQAGDVLIAVASSGLHSNGFSLARRALQERMKLSMDALVPELGVSLGEALLTPTTIYATAVARLRAACGDGLHALAHITGGGLVENLPRVLPEGLAPQFRLGSFPRPPIFELIAKAGPVDENELRRTFNLGVGMVAAVAADTADLAVETLSAAGQRAWPVGAVVEAKQPATLFV